MRADNANYVDNVRSIFQSPAIRQLMFMVGVAVSVALGIVLYMSIQEPIYQPLDYQVTQQNMSAIIDTLGKADIQYKINDRDGIVLVPAKDVQAARMKLVAAGVARDSGFNYSYLNEQGSFGNSQFVENARYLRALETDLSRTISSIEGVSAARVHIAVPRNNTFADENNKVTASVVLNISPGFVSDKEKIRSIIQVVADSVPGLDPKDIAITDQYGHFLSESLNIDSIYNAAQLNYQNNMQSYYEKRIEAMIVPILGENKVTVKVNANIDFTQQEDAEEQYDPDKKALRSEQTMSEQVDAAGGASGPPGSLSNTPPSQQAQGGQSGQGGQGQQNSQGGGGTQGRNQSTRNYELTKTVSYKKANFAKIKSLSVAVVADNEMVLDPKTKQYVAKPIDQDKINKITELVKATIGYDQARGDKVTVVNSRYNLTKENIAPIPMRIWNQPWFWDMVKKVIGIPLGFAFLFILYRKLTKLAESSRQPKHRQQVVEDVEIEDNATANKMHEFKQEGMNKLKQLAATEPNQVALIIKNWVGKH